MWNSKQYAAMAILGAGLAFAAATPASAWGSGAYGYGGCGAYGYAPVYGYASGCGYGAYGYAPAYAGVYSYGWPYGAVGLGYGGCGAYGYAPAYGYAGGCGYGAYGYAPTYGYASGCAYGYAPSYGYAASYGYGCRARHLHGHGGYALAYAPRSSAHRQYYASASSPRYSSNASMRARLASVK